MLNSSESHGLVYSGEARRQDFSAQRVQLVKPLGGDTKGGTWARVVVSNHCGRMKIMMKVHELKSTYSDPINSCYVCLGLELTAMHCVLIVSELLTLQHIDIRLTSSRDA